MSIVNQQKDLESFSDQMLLQESQQPTGRYPPFLIITEMERRRDLRQRAQAQNYKPEPTVSQKLESSMASGIVGADQGAPSGNIPGMQMGIAKFANGGYVDGYQAGGDHGDPRPWWAMFRPAKRYDVVTGRWVDTDDGRSPLDANWYRDQGLSMPTSLQIEDPLDIYLGRPRGYNTDRPDMGGRIPHPHEPYDLVGDTRDTMRPSWDSNMAEAEGAQDAFESRGRERIGELQEISSDMQGKLSALSDELMASVEDTPSNLEKELQDFRRTPGEQKGEKIAIALSGLGSLIASGKNVGAGLGDLTGQVLERGQEMREEDIQLATQAGMMEEARKQRNIDLKTRALETDVRSADVRRLIANDAYNIESNMMESRNRLNQLRAQGELTIAGALAEAEQIEQSLIEAHRIEQVGKVMSPNVVSNLIGSLTRAVQDARFTNPQEASDLMDKINRFTEFLSIIVGNQYGPRNPEIDELFQGQPIGPANGLPGGVNYHRPTG